MSVTLLFDKHVLVRALLNVKFCANIKSFTTNYTSSVFKARTLFLRNHNVPTWMLIIAMTSDRRGRQSVFEYRKTDKYCICNLQFLWFNLHSVSLITGCISSDPWFLSFRTWRYTARPFFSNSVCSFSVCLITSMACLMWSCLSPLADRLQFALGSRQFIGWK